MVLVFPGPPQIGAVGAGVCAAVGEHDGAVQVQMPVTGDFGRSHGLGQVRGAGGQGDDAFVQVVVGGGLPDPVIDGELRHPGAVQEPADHQHRLPVAAQRPPSLPRSKLDPAQHQQPSQVLPGIEHGGVGHDGAHAKPRGVRVIDEVARSAVTKARRAGPALRLLSMADEP